MNLYTIGFTKKSAKQFFEIIKSHSIDLIVDIRLNNKSQLAGFTKGEDLAYFLQEICGCAYKHFIELAPTKEILDEYKAKKISWSKYEIEYNALIGKRNASTLFLNHFSDLKKIALLCSEPTAEQCHRRLAAEAIVSLNRNISLMHI
jgi:uncharacterized protein (DUF488 family)